MTSKGKTLAVLLALGLYAFALPTYATTFANRPIKEVITEADFIVRGRTGEGYSAWDKTGRKSLYTYTPLTVTEVLKGTLKDNRILLRQPGGSKDGIEMSVPGSAQFHVDEDVVVLIGKKNTEDDSYDVPGFTTGKYEVSTGANGETLLTNSLGGGAIYDPAHDAHDLSYNAKIPLSAFRKLAKGESLPEGSQKQFQGSKHKDVPEEKSNPIDSVRRDPNLVNTGEARPDENTQPNPIAESNLSRVSNRMGWIPISFIVFIFGGGLLFWFLSRPPKQ